MMGCLTKELSRIIILPTNQLLGLENMTSPLEVGFYELRGTKYEEYVQLDMVGHLLMGSGLCQYIRIVFVNNYIDKNASGKHEYDFESCFVFLVRLHILTIIVT